MPEKETAEPTAKVLKLRRKIRFIGNQLETVPADLNRTLSRGQRRRVPHNVSQEMVKGCVVCFRASTSVAELKEDGKQLTDKDGNVSMVHFEPVDEVPDWIFKGYPVGSWIAQGRIYCQPLPVLVIVPIDKSKPVNTLAPVGPALTTTQDRPDFGLLNALKSNALKAKIKAALDAAKVEAPNSASKRELLGLVKEALKAGE